MNAAVRRFLTSAGAGHGSPLSGGAIASVAVAGAAGAAGAVAVGAGFDVIGAARGLLGGYGTGTAACLVVRWILALLGARSRERLGDPTKATHVTRSLDLMYGLLLAVASGKLTRWSKWSAARQLAFAVALLCAVYRVFGRTPMTVLLTWFPNITPLGPLACKGHLERLPAQRRIQTAGVRAIAKPLDELLGFQPSPNVRLTQQQCIGQRGVAVSLRIFSPTALTSGTRSIDCLVYYHGGGFVLFGSGSHDALCAQIAERCSLIVVSVDYRLAPEHPFPAAFEDAVAGFKWVADNQSLLNIDPNRVFVCGDSAGGNLAAAVSLYCRDTRSAVVPVGQILLYPVVSWKLDTFSVRENRDNNCLTEPLLRWFKRCYLTDPKDHNKPYACPLFANSHEGLPPALIMIPEFDPLKDDGINYAQALAADNVQVQIASYPATPHFFMTMALLHPTAFEKGLRDIEHFVNFVRTVKDAVEQDRIMM